MSVSGGFHVTDISRCLVGSNDKSFVPSQKYGQSNNLLKRTGTLKAGQASKVLFRSVALRKRMPARLTGR